VEQRQQNAGLKLGIRHALKEMHFLCNVVMCYPHFLELISKLNL